MRVVDSARAARRTIAAAVLAAGLASTSAAHAVPRTFEIDPNHLFITFLVEQAGYSRIIGRFMRGTGSFVYDVEDQSIDSGTLRVFSKSVFTGHYQRDKRLRSKRFLNVSEYPEIEFEISRFVPSGPGAGQLVGQLTMLGETNEVTFDLTINRVSRRGGPEGPYVLGASARMTIARSRWGMTQGAALLSDGVELMVELQAYQSSD